MPRILLLNDDVNERINKLIEHAKANPFSMDDLLDIMNKAEPPAGDRPGFLIMIPDGYKVVYSLEDQVKGRVKHISISVDTPNQLPSMTAVSEIISWFGFELPLDQNIIRVEGEEGKVHSVNVWAIEK